MSCLRACAPSARSTGRRASKNFPTRRASGRSRRPTTFTPSAATGRATPPNAAAWANLMNSTLGASDPELNPHGIQGAVEKDIPEIFDHCGKLIAERREHPTDDLTSVLVHAEVDGEKLEEHEIVMGFFLLVAAGNDSTKATYSSGMRALMEDDEQRRLLLEDPALVPDAVEESLRMFPAFAHFRRTATCDTELHGQKIKAGEKVVMWYASSNRDESRYEHP